MNKYNKNKNSFFTEKDNRNFSRKKTLVKRIFRYAKLVAEQCYIRF